MNNFEKRLTGGHPNSLGDTLVIVAEVLANPQLFAELFACYFSADETVRLRTSNAMKRIGKEKKALLIPYIDRFIDEVSQIDQPSTQWTLSQLFQLLEQEMQAAQRAKAEAIMRHNLAHHHDWIVLNTTMDTLGKWAKKDENLKDWLLPHLERLMQDSRKSVAGRAKKIHAKLNG
ncbi:MAG: hypothetical protein AAFN10_07355 [Bacteroidota bacterium]